MFILEGVQGLVHGDTCHGRVRGSRSPSVGALNGQPQGGLTDPCGESRSNGDSLRPARTRSSPACSYSKVSKAWSMATLATVAYVARVARRLARSMAIRKEASPTLVVRAAATATASDPRGQDHLQHVHTRRCPRPGPWRHLPRSRTWLA